MDPNLLNLPELPDLNSDFAIYDLQLADTHTFIVVAPSDTTDNGGIPRRFAGVFLRTEGGASDMRECSTADMDSLQQRRRLMDMLEGA